MNRQRAATSPSLQLKISRLEQNFKQAYISQGEPLSFCNAIIKSVNNQRFQSSDEQYKFKMYRFADEINLVKQGESFPQAIKKLIVQREEIIRQLRSELIGNRNTKQLNLTTACEKLENIRMYGLLIIQQVHACRKKLKIRQSSYFNDVMQKLGQDVDFLRLSGLRKYIQFSNHIDPLFMTPFKKFWSLEHVTDSHHRRPIIDLFTLDAEYQKRLDVADNFLRNIQKRDDKSQSMINGIQTKAIIERAVEEDIKNDQNQGQYISTLQKFTLPSLRNKNRLEKECIGQSKTKEMVSNLIKEVISEYKAKSKDRNINKHSDVTRKKVSRSIDRSDIIQQKGGINDQHETKANNIRYRMGRISSLKANELDKAVYQQKFQKYNGRILRPTKRTTQTQKQKIDRSLDKYDKLNGLDRYLYNQNYEHDSSEPHYPKQIFQQDIQVKNSRIKSGKIRFNQLNNINKIYTQPTQRYDIPVNEPNHQIKMDRNQGNSMGNSLIYKSKLMTPIKQVYMSHEDHSHIESPLIERQNLVKSPHLMVQKAIDQNKIQDSNRNEEVVVKIHQSCRISQQFSYHQILSNTMNQSTVKAEPKAEQPRMIVNKSVNTITPDKQQQKRTKLRVNFQYNQQIYCPPLVSNKNLKIDIKNQADSSKKNTSNNDQTLKINAQIKQKVEAVTKDNSIPPYSIRSMNKQTERYEINRIQQQIENQNVSSQRTSQNKSQNKVEDYPKKSQSIRQSVINPILQQSEKSDSYKKSISNNKNSNNSNKPSNESNKNSNGSNKDINNTNNNNKSNQSNKASSVGNSEINSIPVSHISLKNSQNIHDSMKSDMKIMADLKSVDSSKNVSLKLDQNNNINQQAPTSRENDGSSLSFRSPSNPQILPNYASDGQVNPAVPKNTTQKYNERSQNGNNVPTKTPVNNSIVRMSNYTPQLQSSPTQRKLIIKQEKQPKQKELQNEKMLQLLQKCAFQSKSIKHKDLIQQIKKMSPQKAQQIISLVQHKFFTYKHLLLSNCIFDNELCGYCICYPHISSKTRTVFIIHLQITKERLLPIQLPLVNTFIKYIFVNDPCQNIVYLKHNVLSNESIIKQLKNYAGVANISFKIDNIDQSSYNLVRKELKCVKEQEHTSILSLINLFAVETQNIELKAANNIYSPQYLKKIEAKIKKQGKRFANVSQLQSHLQHEDLPEFKTSKLKKQAYFTSYLLEDCLVKSKFFVYSKQFYFTVDYPFTSLYEGKSAFFLALSVGINNKYFILGDKLYEDSPANIQQAFRTEVQGRQFDRIFSNQKFANKIVTCPTFRKHYQPQMPSCDTLMAIQLNWKDYIKGIRYLEEEQIYLQLVTPFFFGLVQVNEEKKIQLLCSATIEQSDLLK